MRARRPLEAIFPTKQNILSGGVGVSQPLFTWGQIGASIRAAKVGLTTAEDQLRLYRQAAYRDVSASFYDILFAKTLKEIAIAESGTEGSSLR